MSQEVLKNKEMVQEEVIQYLRILLKKLLDVLEDLRDFHLEMQ